MSGTWPLTVLVSVSLVVSGDGVFFVFIGLSLFPRHVPPLVLWARTERWVSGLLLCWLWSSQETETTGHLIREFDIKNWRLARRWLGYWKGDMGTQRCYGGSYPIRQLLTRTGAQARGLSPQTGPLGSPGFQGGCVWSLSCRCGEAADGVSCCSPRPYAAGTGRSDGGGGGRPEGGVGAPLCLHPFQCPMLDTLTGIWPGPASEAGGRVGWGLGPSGRRQLGQPAGGDSLWLPAVQNKVCHCFPCFPIYLPWSDGTRGHDLRFLNVEF